MLGWGQSKTVVSYTLLAATINKVLKANDNNKPSPEAGVFHVGEHIVCTLGRVRAWSEEAGII
jgi:hypothetical protein